MRYLGLDGDGGQNNLCSMENWASKEQNAHLHMYTFPAPTGPTTARTGDAYQRYCISQ